MISELLAVFLGMMAGLILSAWSYSNSNPSMVYTEYKETIAKCEADLPRNKTCTAKIIAEVTK